MPDGEAEDARIIHRAYAPVAQRIPARGSGLDLRVETDGYRALAIKTGGEVQLRSRNDNNFNGRYPLVVKGLAAMPDETVLDGEIVALDEEGRSSFNWLQNYGS